jgi:hypothetical protein
MKSWIEQQQEEGLHSATYADLKDIDPRFRPLMLRAIEQSRPAELDRLISECLQTNPVCMDSATILAMQKACELAHWHKRQEAMRNAYRPILNQSAPAPTVPPATERADRWTKVAAYVSVTLSLIYLAVSLLR